MASITTWMHIEPHSRSTDMRASMEMRVHDPLWMLARQWQFGEFRGEDNGSPVWAEVTGETSQIDLYLPGPLAGHTKDDVQPYSAGIVPLEYLIERERIPASEVMAANRRSAAEAGLYFLHLLDPILVSRYKAALLSLHAFNSITQADRDRMDVESVVFLDLMVGRALDGARILEVIQNASPQGRATALGFAAQDATQVELAIDTWLNWCDETIGPVKLQSAARSSWEPQRMEYACALAAPHGSPGNQVVLVAREYTGGHLDWYSFDAIDNGKLERVSNSQPQSLFDAAPPTNLNFRGLPSSRLWEFEDAQVRFASIDAASTDLARQIFVEFIAAYGNDFYQIPLEVQSGSLVQIQKITVTNTFGDVTTALPLSGSTWKMFALSGDTASPSAVPAGILFVPPVISQQIVSEPIEDLQLLRDEMANIVWAVEHVVESACGKPLKRHEIYQIMRERQSALNNQPPVIEGTLVYKLDTLNSTLPDYWIPFEPELISAGQGPARLMCEPSLRSRGRLLREGMIQSKRYLYDEEVPRMGAHVLRQGQYTRWYNGSVLTWIGREKRPGRGEGTSGLQHDIVEVAKTP